LRLDALDQAAACRDRATLTLDAGDASAALSHARAALGLLPDDASARLIEARALVMLGRGREALASLDALHRSAAGDIGRATIDALRLVALRQAGRLDLALRLAEQRWAADETDTAAAHAVVTLRLALDDRRGAIDALRRQIGNGHATPAMRRQFAELVGPRDPQAAIDALASDAPDDRLTRLRLARWCAQAGRFAEAETHYVSVLDAAPRDPTPWVEAGRLAMRLGLTDTAAARLGHALSLPGDHHDEARTALAVTWMHAGRFARAGRQWWKLTRRSGAALAGWAGLLVCAHVTGRDALVRRAEARLRAHTSEAERRRMLASVWREAAGPDAVSRALIGSPPSASPRHLLAGMVREAAHVLARQAEATPGRADVHYHHAVLEAARGDTTTAQLAISRALAINPRYADARRFAEQREMPLRLAASSGRWGGL